MDVHLAGRQRDARADRAAAVPPQQLLDLRRDDVVAARAVVEDAELVLHLLRPVDRDRHADAFSARNSMISGFSSVALVVRLKSTSLPTSAARCLAYAIVFWSTGKFSSVSPPKNVMCATLLSPDFLEHEVDALPRRFLAHELRLLAVLGIDDLVLAVLVAVGAAQVALVGDVEDHRRQRERRQRDHLRRRRRTRRRSRQWPAPATVPAIVSRTSDDENRSSAPLQRVALTPSRRRPSRSRVRWTPYAASIRRGTLRRWVPGTRTRVPPIQSDEIHVMRVESWSHLLRPTPCTAAR